MIAVIGYEPLGLELESSGISRLGKKRKWLNICVAVQEIS